MSKSRVQLEYKRNTGPYENYTCTMSLETDAMPNETDEQLLDRVYETVAKAFEARMAEDANALTHG